ncbi:ROK family protein [Candidatus Pacearchaeota archaeon]|jgi:glucokinase|nr:ROK family protein [Candidatus Pacearchaeota archaeon]HNZ52296.1 ROK family protein [Candidatus Pacearchaeota archaeon]HOC96724.1 ROK family protein [Candidatus Pacearchaeota archaeon]HOF44255.1 ROK family protein [Candidatus Pacearchaeota archaeon]HOH04364.1 ROK family protein [Candidatus Pacearchaeota archaeon]
MAGKVIAVDLGGTNLRVSLVENNKVVKYIKNRTPKTQKELENLLFKGVEELMEKDVKGIGVASAGPLEKGIIKNPPNLPLRNYNIKAALEKRFKKRVEVCNDAHSVAFAELKLGVKKKNFIVLTIGTGVGGGIIIDGKLYEGRGYGGEMGHIILDDGKSFEKLVGWKYTKELSKKAFGKELIVSDLIKLNNPKSKAILNQITKYLGQGIGSLINVFDPEVVVLAGGVKETGQVYLNMIKKEAEKYVILPRKTPIQWSKLDHPGVLGASLLIN